MALDRETARAIDNRLSEAQELLGQVIRLAYENDDHIMSSRISKMEQEINKQRVLFRKQYKLAGHEADIQR